MPDRYDVIIVGAGPAGSALATLLARAGQRVALLDAASFPRQKVCGEYLGAGAWPVLEMLGVAPAIQSIAVPVCDVSLVLPTGARLSATVEPPPGAGPARGACCTTPVALSRYRLDHLLVEAAAHAGAEVMLETRVGDVLIDRDRVCGVAARSSSASSAPLQLQARVLVAADGRNSRIVAQTGQRSRRGPAIVGFKRYAPPEDAAGLPAGMLEMHSLSGGYVGVCRVEDGQTNLCGVLPRRLVSAARGAFTAAIGNWIGEQPALAHYMDSANDESRWWTVADVSTQSARPCVAGVLYVGDACGTIEPLTGQGMTMALTAALLASQSLTSAASESLDSEAQVAYDGAWHAQFNPVIRRARAMGWLLRHPRVIQRLTQVDRLRAGLAERIFGQIFRHSSGDAVARRLAPAAPVV